MSSFLRLPHGLLPLAVPDLGLLSSLIPLQVCTAFPAEYAKYGHVKMHHGYTNVVGLGDSSTWKLPCLNRYVYMFLAPFLIPIVTPLVALGEYCQCLSLRTLQKPAPSPSFPLLASWETFSQGQAGWKEPQGDPSLAVSLTRQ